MLMGKSAFSGNLQPFQDCLTTLTGISDNPFITDFTHIAFKMIENQFFRDSFISQYTNYAIETNHAVYQTTFSLFTEIETIYSIILKRFKTGKQEHTLLY